MARCSRLGMLLLGNRSFLSLRRTLCCTKGGRSFSKGHEWLVRDGDIATIGITEHAQLALGEVVFVCIDKKYQYVKKDEPVGVVESSKAASDIFSPVSGTVIEINSELNDRPNLINCDPDHAGWIFKVKLSQPDELAELMTEEQYQSYLNIDSSS